MALSFKMIVRIHFLIPEGSFKHLKMRGSLWGKTTFLEGMVTEKGDLIYFPFSSFGKMCPFIKISRACDQNASRTPLPLESH